MDPLSWSIANDAKGAVNAKAAAINTVNFFIQRFSLTG
jgi:hypothetical protein